MSHFKDRINKTYSERAQLTNNPMTKQLLELMDKKKTNLILANDETNTEKFLERADWLGPEIAVLKTHIDIIDDFTPKLIEKLVALAKKHQFLIFEDRKFADIGNTVKMQYGQGIFRIADWAHLTNAHIVPGPGIIEGLQTAAANITDPRGLILLAQMSSKGNLAIHDYTKHAMAMAEQYAGFVVGFIGNGGDVNELKKLTILAPPQFIIFTPGVKMGGGADKLKQQYTTPADVIQAGSDSIIVGRGIYGADNPQKATQEYRQAGWEAYKKRINN
ncbi:orotidine-5'-phosphate decarboxylase [Patescibacteria group bacterium]|nr:orotidine-5'-phosphate decarboxylase [Patescibacteria group bacterium]MBU0963889.1 orotidine-5'-phosphate decarboxylase [Patescibacteria group bacterium]